jgi:pyruvate kinase
VAHEAFPSLAEVGATILADDGTLRFTVLAVEGPDVTCRAEIAGTLRSRKGLNMPSRLLPWHPLSPKDEAMIAFARAHQIDFVGLSFVESAEHIQAIRQLAGDESPRIIAKIETQGGYDHRDEILAMADAVMIDRGDLASETSLETMTIYQKEIISTARRHSKPVIVATEMLHSMIEHPTPTKAEVSDISNAAMDGASAVMLSGETAVGPFGVHSVEVLDRILKSVESYMDDHGRSRAPLSREALAVATGKAIGSLCEALSITKVVAITISGFAARVLSAQGLRQPILAVSNQAAAARSFRLLPGTRGIHVDVPFSRQGTEHVPVCLHRLWELGLVDESDVILVTGLTYPHEGLRMNTISIHGIQDLKEALGWATPKLEA